MEKLNKEELLKCNGGMYFSTITNIIVSIINVVKIVSLMKRWRR